MAGQDRRAALLLLQQKPNLALREEVLAPASGMGANGMGGQWYGRPLLWVALWLLKDPMLRRGSGCAAVTPG